jgi:hypothetical protein
MTTKKKKTTTPTELPPPPENRTRQEHRIALRRKVEIFYDLQRLRMQAAGRTENKKDGTAKVRATTIELTAYDTMVLERRAKELHLQEKAALRDVQEHLNQIGFYRDILSDKKRYRGVGPTMAGVILSSFDIEREDTVSKMWAFAGLRPMPCKRCKACNVVVEVGKKHPKAKCIYIENAVLEINCYESGKAQKPQPGEKLPYNAWLRTKLVGVLGSVLIKLNSPWRKAYDDYKHRKQTAGWGVSDGHRHNAAVRYMIKMLLLDIYKEWRTYENLPVRPSYHEEKQGHVHSAPTEHVPWNAEEISPEIEEELALAEGM